MKNTLKLLTVLSMLAGFSACGDDDSNNTDVGGKVDAGGSVGLLDSGLPDTGASNTTDSSVNPGSDSGTTPVDTSGCFNGTPVTMANFLNRCTTAQTATKTINLGDKLNADGTVKPL